MLLLNIVCTFTSAKNHGLTRVIGAGIHSASSLAFRYHTDNTRHDVCEPDFM